MTEIPVIEEADPVTVDPEEDTQDTDIETSTEEPESPDTDVDPEAAELMKLLEENSGNVSAVARELDKDRKQVRRLLKDYEIDPADYRS